MMTREQYVEQMKKQLDEWNAKLGQWEQEVQKAQASVKSRYAVQIEALQRQRDETIRRLNEARDSSQAAWIEVSKTLDSAWQSMQSSLDKAWGEFHKKK